MKLTKDETARLLIEFGYVVDRSYKFKIRDEHTASASINPKDGKIKDFGSGWYGDIIDFLVEFENYNKKDAFEKIENMLGKINFNQSINFSKNLNIETSKEIKNSFITQDIIDKFQNERKENFDRYWELLGETLPTASNQDKKEIAQKYEIGYSKQADRLIMPIRNENGKCLTLWKYNPEPNIFFDENKNPIKLPKVMFTKNRNRCPFNFNKIFEYKKSDEPIFLVEGEKDCLNALANGFNAITLGSASAKIENKYLNLFKDTHIAIAYDLDDSGKNGASAIKEQLKDICYVEIIDWKKIAKRLNFSNKLKKGFDFTDYLISINNTEKSVKIEKEL